jgi:hypothetical protein
VFSSVTTMDAIGEVKVIINVIRPNMPAMAARLWKW